MFKQFTLALIVAASVSAKQHFNKHFVDYMHGDEKPTDEYLLSLIEERRAKLAAGENVEPLTIHLVPHTHDDIGWLKTIDGYYSGVDQDIAIANVSKILDTVIAQLIIDETKVFTYVEMKFFSMWFYRQTATRQDQVRQLVKNHQLEFINAGWSMHDEACTHFDDMMNNMMIGHEFLLKEFDYKPTIGWHIDPFGHSNANPRLFADMGFDTFIFGRLDYEDRDQRLADKNMQFVWKPFSESLGDSVEIFTHILQDMYWFPPDMGYDERDFPNNSQPIIDDETLETFNADLKAERMLSYAMHMSTHYRSNNLFMPWGEDFAYGNAFTDFSNGDALISYWQKKMANDVGISMRYSTVYDYVNAVKAENITWPTKYDDMFPYADWEDQYWSGYFTSRANSKSQVRFGQQNLNASNKAFSDLVIDQETTNDDVAKAVNARYTMLDSMSSYQHHDAITGTAKQAVADDYSHLLSKSMDTSNVVFEKYVADYTAAFSPMVGEEWKACTVNNSTWVDCPVANDTDTFAVSFFNPSIAAIEIQTFKVPPATSYDVQVWDYDYVVWQPLKSTLLCYDYLENNAEHTSYQDCNLHIKAINIRSLYWTYIQLKANHSEEEVKPLADVDTISTSTASLKYTGQSDAGASMFTYTTAANKKSYDFEFNLQYYNPSCSEGENLASSGAYLFVPQINDQDSHLYSEFSSIETKQGELASEFSLVYKDSEMQSVYQTHIRLSNGSEPIEFEVQMLEIPLIDNKGREVVAKWSFDGIDNQDTFYTDSNGLEMQKRVKDSRPDFTLDTKMKVNDNYYPINSAIAMRDTTKNIQVTVMNQHSQGGGVIQKGTIELMQNRRLLCDDNKGVDEALNETQPDGRGIAVNTKYFVTITDLSSQKSTQRQTQLKIDEPLQFFYCSNFTTRHWIDRPSEYVKMIANMVQPLETLKILLQPEARNQILMRVENLADLFDGTPEKDVTLDIRKYALYLYAHNNSGFKPAAIEVTERTINNNQDYNSMKQNKFKWKSADPTNARLAQPQPEDLSDTNVTLEPQRIRLFRIVFIPPMAGEEELVVLQ